MLLSSDELAAKIQSYRPNESEDGYFLRLASPKIEDKDSWADPYMGCKGERVEELHDEMFPDSQYFAHYFDSKDGNCYTCLIAITEHKHEIRPFTNRYAYQFAKQFRRKDGKIIIE